MVAGGVYSHMCVTVYSILDEPYHLKEWSCLCVSYLNSLLHLKAIVSHFPPLMWAIS
jgi:hypothetical protein